MIFIINYIILGFTNGLDTFGLLLLIALFFLIRIIYRRLKDSKKRQGIRQNHQSETNPENNKEVTLCLKCNKPINVGSKFCKFCGMEQFKK